MNLTRILEELSLFSDNDEMLYDYIISKSKSLPLLPELFRTEDYKIHGCMSIVYLKVTKNNEGTYIEGYSDSSVLSGILGILSECLKNDVQPEEITYKELLEKIKFVLSQNRRLGFQNILLKIFK